MKVPSWVVKVIVTTVFSAAVAGAVAWARSQSAAVLEHGTRIAVVEQHQRDRDREIDKSLDEIKQDMKEVLRTLRNGGGRK